MDGGRRLMERLGTGESEIQHDEGLQHDEFRTLLF